MILCLVVDGVFLDRLLCLFNGITGTIGDRSNQICRYGRRVALAAINIVIVVCRRERIVVVIVVAGLKRRSISIGAFVNGLIVGTIHFRFLLLLFDCPGHGKLFILLLLSLNTEQVTSIPACELVQGLRFGHFETFIVTLGKKFLLTLLNLGPFLLDTEHLLALPLLNELAIADVFLLRFVTKLPENVQRNG